MAVVEQGLGDLPALLGRALAIADDGLVNAIQPRL
jgi:hypothetical protein